METTLTLSEHMRKALEEELQQIHPAIKASFDENHTKLTSQQDNTMTVLSHDLRLPFISILGFCEILLNEKNYLTDEERTEYITYIKESAQHQLNLVNSLLG
jgi:signal transduction histidine kinase